jgi:glycosyltransferase involved in cell wall biosynthesis
LNINKKLYDNLIRSEKNKGKGFAIKKAMPFINGDIVIIQDADLEYNPADYKNILTPFTESGADVVYGNRFANNNYQRLHFFSHKIANIIITLIVNFVTNINFSDVECGFKAFKAEIFKSILLNEKSFGFEIEITKKISKLNLKIFQAPVSYNGRNYSEGKKIKFKDALRAIYCIFRY